MRQESHSHYHDYGGVCHASYAIFTGFADKQYSLFSGEDVCERLSFLIDNISIKIGNTLYRHKQLEFPWVPVALHSSLACFYFATNWLTLNIRIIFAIVTTHIPNVT